MRNTKYQVFTGPIGSEWKSPKRFYWKIDRALKAISIANKKGWNAVLLTLRKLDNEQVLSRVHEYNVNN